MAAYETPLPAWWGDTATAVWISSIVFGCSSILVFFKPRWAYVSGITASALAWPHYVELSRYVGVLAANSQMEPAFGRSRLVIGGASILSLIFATALSLTQLWPARRPIGHSTSGRRAWPLLLASCLMVAIVAVLAMLAAPKMIVDGVKPKVIVAHVQKRGGKVHETTVAVMRDHRYVLNQVDRGFFLFRPNCRYWRSVLPDDMFQRLKALLDSPEFTALRASRSTVPQNWNSDTWYVSVLRNSGTQLLVFSSVDSGTSEPPTAIIEWFNETLELRPAESERGSSEPCSMFSDDTLEEWRK
jgi:hypothetical protein